MIVYGQGLVGFILSVITLIHGLLADIVSFIVICTVIHHQYSHRLKREEKITLLLSTNIYILMFIYITPIIVFNFQTILGDIYGYNFDSSWCKFNGFFVLVICCALYHAFVLQALFRLYRIVCSQYRWFGLYSFYLIIIPVKIVLSFIIVSPVFIWQTVTYLPNDYLCCVSFRITRGILWALFTCYGVPLIYLSLIYVRITLFLRHQSTTITNAIKRRQQRDLLAIQRVLINVGLLVTTGLPAMVLLIIFFVTGDEHPLLYRILWIGAEVSMGLLSIEMVFMTPQLKSIVIKQWRPWQWQRTTTRVENITIAH